MPLPFCSNWKVPVIGFQYRIEPSEVSCCEGPPADALSTSPWTRNVIIRSLAESRYIPARGATSAALAATAGDGGVASAGRPSTILAIACAYCSALALPALQRMATER